MLLRWLFKTVRRFAQIVVLSADASRSLLERKPVLDYR
jgi:hypothetical protein